MHVKVSNGSSEKRPDPCVCAQQWHLGQFWQHICGSVETGITARLGVLWLVFALVSVRLWLY